MHGGLTGADDGHHLQVQNTQMHVIVAKHTHKVECCIPTTTETCTDIQDVGNYRKRVQCPLNTLESQQYVQRQNSEQANVIARVCCSGNM